MEEATLGVVLVTAPDEECAAAIARTLVSERLAACCSLLPQIRSIYRWEGAVQDAREVLLLCKVPVPLFAALESRIRALHPYEIPEIILLPVTDGSEPYVSWVLSSCASGNSR